MDLSDVKCKVIEQCQVGLRDQSRRRSHLEGEDDGQRRSHLEGEDDGYPLGRVPMGVYEMRRQMPREASRQQQSFWQQPEGRSPQQPEGRSPQSVTSSSSSA